MMYSYRDPKLAESYELYDSLGDRVRALELTQADVDGFIVSAFSWLSMPEGPMTGGKQAVSDALCGRDSFDLKLRCMREAKQMTPEDVTELAALLDVMAEQGAKVSVNSQKLVAENSELFAVPDDCFMFSGSMPEGDEAEEASGEVDEAA